RPRPCLTPPPTGNPGRPAGAERKEAASSGSLGQERERERDVSALLTHLPTEPSRPVAIPDTYVPNELTRKQLPHRKRNRSLSTRNPYCATKADHTGKTPTRSMSNTPPRDATTETL